MAINVKDQVRLLISDVGGKDGESFIFTDEEIQTFLIMRGEVIQLAAATALRTIAGNESQVSKRITFLELKTDGPAVTKELRALADDIEKTYKEDAEEEEDSMEIAEMNVGPFAEGQLIDKRMVG